MVKLTIDDKIIEADEGVTILDAASQASIRIPTLCYYESLSRAGSCRLCVVEVTTNGKSELTAACTYPVEAGLKVSTNSDKVMEARRLAVELLLAQRPHSAKLQDLARKLGVEEPRFTLKPRECILCDLCVRACREIVGAEAITFIAQGKDRGVDEAMVLHSPEKCIGCDSCAYVCPTEAIIVRDVGDTRTLKTPSGELEFKLKQCKVCGKYWAPEKQLEYIIKKWNLEPEIFDNCPDCRD
jgi:NADH dehydrogenase/NADH:ubiquinone oxidoreductase subunit G